MSDNTELSTAQKVDATTRIMAMLPPGSVTISNVVDVMGTVFASVGQLGAVEPAPPPPPLELVPAVAIKKSITPEFLVCLDDGKKFKSLKRHLTSLGMTPSEYRAKWGLPDDYPMVAPVYANKRSELAKLMGLGKKAAA